MNRQCDAKRLFEYVGLKNDQSEIKMEFVFINQTYYDPQFRRTFQPAQAPMFACNQSVILPHISRQKCTCMVGDIKFNLSRREVCKYFLVL